MQRKRPGPIAVPIEGSKSYLLTNTGTFMEGDLTISREGMQISNSPASNITVKESSTASSNIAPIKVASETIEVTPVAVATAPPTPVDLSPDDLEDLGIIGQGSSGLAKKVRVKSTGDIRVLKVIQFDVNSDVVRKQITTELRTLYGACHPNVVRYLQAFFDEGAITIVMEYMDAGSLADVLSRHRRGLPERYVAAIARQIMAGLYHLHKDLRVVHRDIKPSNLLLNSNGELKISDFGVSGQLGSSVSNCLSWVGTVTYMSPERIKGESYSYDSDLWSLGLTLLECALGRFPYPPPGESASLGFWELLEYIVMEPAPLLPHDQFSPELCDFVSICLQKDSRNRPSVSHLLQHPFLKKHQDASLADLLKPIGAGGG
eukprot:CAMPEP_0175041644 /NCGR_PEP_ID=MMETSP0052_2-20121109/2048_1 /TAXON_ID=51329 ORGANISM="Polytomella parva, Strain SAG 63-3" /NCGR_SAMPLE_ID=MMETSP0052_2 /ASSEMBLY_ACC=CAM_ASM_000194 /LENGTH=374 /DNA_ID=CAMNT_0016304219 /DNA_START=83 /DNA_END=1204 /DNA_ORIENTATION=+